MLARIRRTGKRFGLGRRLLIAGGTDVTGAAHAVGYDSPSQFSREHRRLFGAPPRRDTVRERGAVS